MTWADYDRFDRFHHPRVLGHEAEDSHPVTEVSWWQAWLYCRWLGGDLPTEAQWEAACRAGADTPWSFGPSESELRAHGWYAKNSDKRTHPVGEKAANAWGLFDMHGNVLEWCHDWYGPYMEEGPRAPSGPPHGVVRVLRGGCAWNDAGWCRSACRDWDLPRLRVVNFGFRVALPPPQPRASILDH